MTCFFHDLFAARPFQAWPNSSEKLFDVGEYCSCLCCLSCLVFFSVSSLSFLVYVLSYLVLSCVVVLSCDCFAIVLWSTSLVLWSVALSRLVVVLPWGCLVLSCVCFVLCLPCLVLWLSCLVFHVSCSYCGCLVVVVSCLIGCRLKLTLTLTLTPYLTPDLTPSLTLCNALPYYQRVKSPFPPWCFGWCQTAWFDTVANVNREPFWTNLKLKNIHCIY